jgi:iron complex outermembrane receptor protein
MLLALLAGWLTAPAAAQQAEQITVTSPGTASQPASTTVLSAGEIARSGSDSLGALLDQLPAFGSQGVNSAQDNGGFGEYFIDLRNLNFDRTLVLVDGQRFVVSGIQTDEAVDLNDIPAAFVDHIEVLADGTQPQYAPDAVAGVVNVVLKDQLEGLRLDTYGAAAGAGDSGTADVSLTGGHSFTDGHIAVGLDAFWRDPVLQSGRAWSADPIASATLTPSGPSVLFGSTAAPGGHAVGSGIDDLALANGQVRPYDAATDFYNPAGGRYLQGSLQRETAYLDGDDALTDSLTANVELLYTDRSATTLLPPQYLGLTGTEKFPNGFVIPATDQFNPFAAPVTLERVVTEAGAQQTTTTGPVWRVLGGLDGVLGAGWGWSATFDHGQSLSHYVTDNEIDLARALQTAGNGYCPSQDGCVLADWFGPNSLSPAAVRYITYTGRSQSDYIETVGQARLSGPVFALPGGQARLTLGLEARSESGATTVDSVTAAGNQAGNDAAPTSGGYDSYGAYTTMALPLLRGLSFARKLDLALVARETSTTRYGNLTALRAALDYTPVQGLELHAVSGTARRPPAISEAFGGITGTPQPVSDPCAQSAGLRANATVNANCQSQGLGPGFIQTSPLVEVLSGGNASLRPEQSENETLGANLQPAALPWLTAKADWYHYRITGAIDSLADTESNFIPDTCYESVRLSSPLCALITRFAGGGNDGQISTILARDENVGTIKTDGLDFDFAATAPSIFGQFKLDWQTNWLLDYRLHTQGQPGFTQYAGTFPGLAGVGLYARVKSRLSADLRRGNWDFSATSRFISGGRVLGDTGNDLFSKAPGIVYQDISFTRQFGKLAMMAGIDNIADTRPPTLIDGQTNTDTMTYDVVGRLIWGRVSYAF